MRKILSLLLTFSVCFILAACGNSEHAEMTGTAQISVAYFSRTGENYSVGNIEKGNTHIVADMIAGQTGGDLFEISTITSYRWKC